MLKSYKYRIYFTPEQELQFEEQANGVRFVYNLALETKSTVWLTSRVNLNFFEMCKQLVELKNSEEGSWLKEINAQALQCSLKNLDSAYTQFFKGKEFPKFKSKKNYRKVIQFTQGVKIISDNQIMIPKFGVIPYIFSRKFEGKIKTCTVSKTPTGKYFISILVDNQEQLPNKKPILQETSVGIDMGIKTLMTLSDGKSYENLRFLKFNIKRLKTEQEIMSRRFKKGMEEQSNSYKKQKQVVALLHEKIANQRKDYLHKITSEIVKNYDTIILEDLDIKGMMKNHNLALAISDVGWGMLNEFLEYKAEWYGKNILRIGRFEPSSRFCDACGKVNKELKLSDRSWACKCGITHDRDQLAARNIKNFGLRIQPLDFNLV